MIETLQSEVVRIMYLFIAQFILLNTTVEHAGFYLANKISVLFRRPGLEADMGRCCVKSMRIRIHLSRSIFIKNHAIV